MGPWTVIYFLCIVLFGRFYLINLVLAVVAASYENEVQSARQVSMWPINNELPSREIAPGETPQ